MIPIRNFLGANPINHCRYNEKYLLHLLRLKQRGSKASLARQTGLTAAAVGGIIKSLQEKGLVETVGKVQGDMGQPATLFSLSKGGAYGLGVSINRGHIETVLVNFVGDVVASSKHEIILPSPQEALALVLKDIDALVSSVASNISSRIAGIGVAQPYNIGSWKQDNADWSAWDSFNLAAMLSSGTGIAAYSQNDVNAAAIAEMIYGANTGHDDFVYAFFGGSQVQSFGGGLILNGECHNGASNNAGDIGLIPVPLGVIPTSGSKDGHATTFLTNRCSLHSLVRYLRSEGAAIQNAEEFHLAINQYPKATTVWINDCVNALESAVYAIQAIVDIPELVIDCEDSDLPIVKRIIQQLGIKIAGFHHRGLIMPSVRKGTFGSAAAAIGAATLPLDSSFSPKATAP